MDNIGYCGDDCELCPRYIATKSNDVEKLKKAAVLWEKVGLNDKIVTPEQMICNGCASLEHCHYNDIRECAKDKEISNCGKCNDYPCDKINGVFNKTIEADVKCCVALGFRSSVVAKRLRYALFIFTPLIVAVTVAYGY